MSALFYISNFPSGGKNLIITLGIPLVLLLVIPAFDRVLLNGTFVFLGFRQTEASVLFNTKTFSNLRTNIPQLANPAKCAVFYFTGFGEAVLSCQVSNPTGKIKLAHEIYVPADKIMLVR